MRQLIKNCVCSKKKIVYSIILALSFLSVEHLRVFVRNKISRLMMRRNQGGTQTFLCRKMLRATFPKKLGLQKLISQVEIQAHSEVVHINLRVSFDILKKFRSWIWLIV